MDQPELTKIFHYLYMQFENVILKTSFDDTEKVKVTFKVFEEAFPNMVLTPFKYGKLGDDLIISLKVDEMHHKPLLELLIKNSFTVMMLDGNTKNIINKLSNKKESSVPIVPKDWEDTKNEIKDVPNDSLDRLIIDGNYREVIKISKNVRANREITTRAENNISTAVYKAVEIIKIGYTKKSFEPLTCIKKTTDIAQDKLLRDLRKDDLLKYAGTEAINMCLLRKDTIRLLIKISNDSLFYHIINLKAAVKFSEIVFSSPELYVDELKEAIKSLNVKWLYLNYDIYKFELTEIERELLEKLIDFVYSERTSSEFAT